MTKYCISNSSASYLDEAHTIYSWCGKKLSEDDPLWSSFNDFARHIKYNTKAKTFCSCCENSIIKLIKSDLMKQ